MKKISFFLYAVLICWLAGSLFPANPPSSPSSAAKKKAAALPARDLGALSNPVKCKNARAQQEYLEKLRDMKGKPVLYERTGHGCSKNGHVLDAYIITSNNGKHSIMIYMDMYCPGALETRPVRGFKIVNPKRQNKSLPAGTPPKSPKQASPYKPVPKPIPPKTAVKSMTPSHTGSGKQNSPRQFANDRIPGFDDVPESPPPARRPQTGKTYISLVPIPVKTVNKQGLPGLLNDVVTKATNAVVKKYPRLALNRDNHTIHDDDTAIKNLHDTLFKSKLTGKQEAGKIIGDILTPNGIDIVFIVHCQERENKVVILRPYIIVKSKKKIHSMNLIFQRDKLLCKNPTSGLPMICRTAGHNISTALQAFLAQAVK